MLTQHGKNISRCELNFRFIQFIHFVLERIIIGCILNVIDYLLIQAG